MLAHAPLQIKHKQAASFHARDVRRLMRGGGMEGGGGSGLAAAAAGDTYWVPAVGPQVGDRQRYPHFLHACTGQWKRVQDSKPIYYIY
jgi:hypothetical protein